MASRSDSGKKRHLEEATESPPAQRPKLGMGKDSAQKERSNSLFSIDSTDLSLLPEFANTTVASSSTTSTNQAQSAKVASVTRAGARLKPRTKQQIANELYVGLVQEMMFNEENLPNNMRKVPWDRRTALGVLLNPLRVPTVMERWCPYEIALFEAAILLYGKNFHLIQEAVKTKSVREVIAFYYDWKKTPHYDQWKKNYVEDEREILGVE